MFEASVDNQYVRDLVTMATAVADEAIFQLDETRFHVSIVDPSGVVLADATLDGDAFERLNADQMRLGMDLNRLHEVVKMGTAGELTEFTYDEDTRKLAIHAADLTYTMALIDPDSIRGGQDIPNLDYTAEVRVETDALQKAIKAAEMVADSAHLGVDDEGTFYLSAAGDTDNMTFEMDESPVTALTDSLQASSSRFSLDFLKTLVKAIPSNTVTLSLGTEMPAVIEFQFANIGDDSATNYAGHGTFAIAPRVDSR